MQITQFRIQKFWNIQDSKWVELEHIAAVVGKNESAYSSPGSSSSDRIRADGTSVWRS
jgi:hypothetical protein